MDYKNILILFLLLSVASVNAYEFDIDIRTDKETECSLYYDYDELANNQTININEGKLKSYKREFNKFVDFNCNVTAKSITYKIVNNENNMIYSETVKNKKNFKFDLNISKVELSLFNANTCTIWTDKYNEKIILTENSVTEYEFLNIFILSCDKNLTKSTLRVYNDKDYNINYKTFTDKQKYHKIDFNNEIINYNNKVSIVFQLYDRKDNFNCKIDSYGKTLTFKDDKNSIIAETEVYVSSEFKMDCNYHFKNIYLYVSDNYLGKEFKEFKYTNVSEIIAPIELFNLEEYNKINLKPVEVINPTNIRDFLRDNSKQIADEVKAQQQQYKKPVIEEIRFSVNKIEPFNYVSDYNKYENITISEDLKFWEKLLIIFKN